MANNVLIGLGPVTVTNTKHNYYFVNRFSDRNCVETLSHKSVALYNKTRNLAAKLLEGGWNMRLSEVKDSTKWSEWLLSDQNGANVVPTHIKGNCLDLILTHTSDNIGPILITQESLILSDHFVLSFTLSTSCHSQEPRSLCRFVPDYSKLNYSDLCNHLFTVDFSDCLLHLVQASFDYTRSN